MLGGQLADLGELAVVQRFLRQHLQHRSSRQVRPNLRGGWAHPAQHTAGVADTLDRPGAVRAGLVAPGSLVADHRDQDAFDVAQLDLLGRDGKSFAPTSRVDSWHRFP